EEAARRRDLELPDGEPITESVAKLHRIADLAVRCFGTQFVVVQEASAAGPWMPSESIDAQHGVGHLWAGRQLWAFGQGPQDLRAGPEAGPGRDHAECLTGRPDGLARQTVLRAEPFDFGSRHGAIREMLPEEG